MGGAKRGYKPGIELPTFLNKGTQVRHVARPRLFTGGRGHTCCASEPGRSAASHAHAQDALNPSQGQTGGWEKKKKKQLPISTFPCTGDALTVHALAVHALQGAGEQPQQHQHSIHLHIPLWPPACFSPPRGEGCQFASFLRLLLRRSDRNPVR